jgi:hypothetical protein
VGGEQTRVRDQIVSALYADLVGPFEGSQAHLTSRELLQRRPSSWYLTGFLVPEGNQENVDEDDELGVGDDVSADDAATEEQEPKQRKMFPASMGFSVLLPAAGEIDSVDVTISFARYEPERIKEEGEKGAGRTHWRRVPCGPVVVRVPLDSATVAKGIPVPNAVGVNLIGRLETIQDGDRVGVKTGTRALSLFLVNRQTLDEKDNPDEYAFFQVQLELRSAKPLVPRPNRRGERSLTDLDARISELQYRERVEYGVGHNVGVEPVRDEDGEVRSVRTRWLPSTEVSLVDARPLEGVEVSMKKLAQLDDGASARAALAHLPEAYREWIGQVRSADVGSKDRTETKNHLAHQAELACRRIEEGIQLLEQNPEILQAFRIANEATALASRKRTPERGEPGWYLFQLAFLLLNLAATADLTHEHRETTELIFFPTGGGKTEAYLGLIAFTLALRRMRGQSEPHRGLGVAVILRYTLRLLTLDQLERATALICALEVIRRREPRLLGKDRFAVGLWVGQSATANTMATVAQQLDDYRAGVRETSPVPLETCPWCRTKLEKSGMELRPSKKKAEKVVVRCVNAGDCEFANPHPDGLPLAFVDEHVYHELPCFLIATVDKFAMMPWRGEAGMLFGRVIAEKEGRFFGPLDKQPKGATSLPTGLLPPELIVQDELHLITGPLGTMVGLYEVAMETLCTREVDGKVIPPKIIASTATAHHAADQIRALYGRKETATFPPPGIDALETYFSVVNDEDPGRLYVGVAAPGHPLKRILLRAYVSVLSAAEKAYRDKEVDPQLADAYMTLVGYFNSLRELGGMRRLVEDDVRYQCSRRSERLPLEIANPPVWFADRDVSEPLELTSREPTGRISETKARLAELYTKQENTDVLLASNMISVGVDIGRLGLMVVAGQPKTTSEYIQATSRVGRERERPGLVVTCFNMARPRDRSHYERFVAYHESFYRFVEAQSVTPFASRALERGLTGALLAMARLKLMDLTRPEDASRVSELRPQVEQLVSKFVERASRQPGAKTTSEETARRARSWAENRLDIWERLVRTARDRATQRTYSPFDISKSGTPLLHTALRPPEDPEPGEEKFCAPTSMRDVEPSVHLWMAQPGVAKREAP